MRASSGRGPTTRARWERTTELPRAVDRVEPLRLAGIDGTISARLVAPDAPAPLALIVAWGSGGTMPRDLSGDEHWARELADLTGAMVVLCGYRRAEPAAASIDVAAAYADLVSRSEQLGADPSRIAVTGQGDGFRLATRLCAEAANWPTIPTPRHCLAATPTPLVAAELRESLGLPAPPRPLHGVRLGAAVFTRDGLALGRIDAIRDGDLVVRRGLALADLAIPQRLVRVSHGGGLTLDLRAAVIPHRDWGRGAVDLAPAARASSN